MIVCFARDELPALRDHAEPLLIMTQDVLLHDSGHNASVA
jgi:hypothetical protein